MSDELILQPDALFNKVALDMNGIFRKLLRVREFTLPGVQRVQ